MKYTLCFIALFILSVLSCGKKPCLSPQDVAIESVPIMKYFNSYKPDSWWVYKNSDGSKKDSVYISSFKAGINYRIESCVSDSSRLMKINSSELFKSFPPSASNLLIKSTEFKEIVISFQDEYSTRNIAAFMRYSFPKIDISQITSYEFLPSITLNSATYFKVLVLNGVNFDKIYLAENIGVVGWNSNTTPVNTVYSLEKYQVN